MIQGIEKLGLDLSLKLEKEKVAYAGMLWIIFSYCIIKLLFVSCSFCISFRLQKSITLMSL